MVEMQEEYRVSKMVDEESDYETNEMPIVLKPKKLSKTYTFSSRDLYKYEVARKEGRLRFPDLFMYHIDRPSEDVQREARMLKELELQNTMEDDDSILTDISSFTEKDGLPTSQSLHTIAIQTGSEDRATSHVAVNANEQYAFLLMFIRNSTIVLGVFMVFVFLWKVFKVL